MSQWPTEIEKFLGKRKVCKINTMADFNKLSVGQVQAAEIVVVNFQVLSSESYFSRLARLSGVDGDMPSGTNGGRHFNAVYDECLASLADRVPDIKSDCAAVHRAIVIESNENAKKERAKESVTLDSKHAAYKKGSTKAPQKPKKVAVKAAELDPWGLSKFKSHNKMLCPPLELFFWNRLVVDE